MSNFSHFFEQDNASAFGGAGNILSGIRPPKIWELGNSINITFGNNLAETFPIPGTKTILGINIEPSTQQIQVATWQNAPIWLYDPSTSGEIGGYVYSPAANEHYLAKVSDARVYRINMSNGGLTNIAPAPDCFTFYSSFITARASYIWASPNGEYQWFNTSTKVISKYSSGFVKLQTRSRRSSVANDSEQWYYSEDTSVRCRSVFNVARSGSGTLQQIYAAKPLLVIERVGSRRAIQITARDVFSSRFRDDLNPVTSTPFASAPDNGWQAQHLSMSPVGREVASNDLGRGLYYGSAVRLGNIARGSEWASDTFLLDRADYDRWLNDVADALGMPKTETFYGDWVDV